MLAVIETHPVQYHAPVYRALRGCGVPVAVIYGSDFSVAGYRDTEFRATFAWDKDLLSGYESFFLSRAKPGAEPRRPDRASARGVRGILDRVSAKAVLLTGYTPPFHFSAAAQAAGRPILLRAETTDHAVQRGPLKTGLRDLYLGSFYARCSKLLYVGAHSREHFLRVARTPEKLVFSPYCVDAASFRPSEEDRAALREECRREWGIGPGEKVVLFSGKLSERKGVDLLVKAAKELSPENGGPVTLLFLGDGERRSALEGSCRQAPAVKAVFTGFRNQSQMSPFYHAADILVLPSRSSETWGLVVNEAMHHGVPCAVSDAVGCAPDLVEEGATGTVFASDSVSGLADALRRTMLLAQDARTRERCRAKVSAYSVKAAAEGIAAAYRAAAGPGEAPRG